MARKDYKGEDDKSRENYIEYEKMKKTTKSPEYKNLLQQFMGSLKNVPKSGQTPNELKKAALKRAAAKRGSKIPASPTR
jgi:hypothetical protein